jgi:hypothetical protein
MSTPNIVRILIADDRAVTRAGLRELFSTRPRVTSSPLKGWLLSDSISRQASTVIAFGCVIGLITALRGGEPNLDVALAFSALIVRAMVLDMLRALSRRDPVYGLPLAWKGLHCAGAHGSLGLSSP